MFALGLLENVASEKNLRGGVVILAEKFVVGVHELALPHGGAGLFKGNALRPLGETEFAGADADSAGFPAPLKFNRKLFFPLVNQYRNSHGSYKNEHASSQNRNKAETAYRLRQTANLRAAHRLQYHA